MPKSATEIFGDRPLEGVIEVRGVLGATLTELGVRVVRGDWQAGEVLPREADMIVALRVSRSVVREALRVLSAKGMVRSRTSDGTRVTPRSAWRLLDPDVIDWRIRAGDTRSLLEDMLKLRLVMEPGLAFEATRLADPATREAVRLAWEAKVRVFNIADGTHQERRDAFIETDLAFHKALLSILGSELLGQLFAIIDAALRLLLDLQMKAVGYTSELIGMDESHQLHEKVYLAFERGDAEAAGTAMRVLIERAIDDAHRGFDLSED